MNVIRDSVCCGCMVQGSYCGSWICGILGSFWQDDLVGQLYFGCYTLRTICMSVYVFCRSDLGNMLGGGLTVWIVGVADLLGFWWATRAVSLHAMLCAGICLLYVVFAGKCHTCCMIAPSDYVFRFLQLNAYVSLCLMQLLSCTPLLRCFVTGCGQGGCCGCIPLVILDDYNVALNLVHIVKRLKVDYSAAMLSKGLRVIVLVFGVSVNVLSSSRFAFAGLCKLTETYTKVQVALVIRLTLLPWFHIMNVCAGELVGCCICGLCALLDGCLLAWVARQHISALFLFGFDLLWSLICRLAFEILCAVLTIGVAWMLLVWVVIVTFITRFVVCIGIKYNCVGKFVAWYQVLLANLISYRMGNIWQDVWCLKMRCCG
eukprot:gene2965-1947_t